MASIRRRALVFLSLVKDPKDISVCEPGPTWQAPISAHCSEPQLQDELTEPSLTHGQDGDTAHERAPK